MNKAIFLAERVVDDVSPNLRLRMFIYRMEPPVVDEEGTPHDLCCVSIYRSPQPEEPQWKGSVFPATSDWIVQRGTRHLFRVMGDVQMDPQKIVEGLGYVSC